MVLVVTLPEVVWGLCGSGGSCGRRCAFLLPEDASFFIMVITGTLVSHQDPSFFYQRGPQELTVWEG